METSSPASITAEIEVGKLLGVEHAHVSALIDDPRRRVAWGIEQINSILFCIDSKGALLRQGRLPASVRKARFAGCDPDGIVYFLDEEAWRIAGVDSVDLSERFSYRPNGSVMSMCAANDGGLIIAAARLDFLEVYSVDRLGNVLWSTPLPYEIERGIRHSVEAFLTSARTPVLVEVQPIQTRLIGFDRNGKQRKTTDWVARNRKAETLADSAGNPYQVWSRSVLDVSSGPVAQSVMMLYTAWLKDSSVRTLIYDWDAGSEPWPRAVLPEGEIYNWIARVGGTSICAVAGSRRSDGRAVIWLVKLAH